MVVLADKMYKKFSILIVILGVLISLSVVESQQLINKYFYDVTPWWQKEFEGSLYDISIAKKSGHIVISTILKDTTAVIYYFEPNGNLIWKIDRTDTKVKTTYQIGAKVADSGNTIMVTWFHGWECYETHIYNKDKNLLYECYSEYMEHSLSPSGNYMKLPETKIITNIGNKVVFPDSITWDYSSLPFFLQGDEIAIIRQRKPSKEEKEKYEKEREILDSMIIEEQDLKKQNELIDKAVNLNIQFETIFNRREFVVVSLPSQKVKFSLPLSQSKPYEKWYYKMLLRDNSNYILFRSSSSFAPQAVIKVDHTGRAIWEIRNLKLRGKDWIGPNEMDWINDSLIVWGHGKIWLIDIKNGKILDSLDQIRARGVTWVRSVFSYGRYVFIPCIQKIDERLFKRRTFIVEISKDITFNEKGSDDGWLIGYSDSPVFVVSFSKDEVKKGVKWQGSSFIVSVYKRQQEN